MMCQTPAPAHLFLDEPFYMMLYDVNIASDWYFLNLFAIIPSLTVEK